MEDAITPAAMAGYWRDGLFGGGGYHYHPQLASTNTTAMDLGRQGCAEGTLVITDSQTGGRGRWNRVWESPPGKNLSFSLVLRPGLAPGQASQLTLLAGVALAEAFGSLGVVGHHLKWPNDLLLGSCKVAGILTESSTMGGELSFVVVGVGVNVNGGMADFPPELRHKVTSLATHAGGCFSRAALLAAFLACFESWYGRLPGEGFAPVRQAWQGYWQARDRAVMVVRGGLERVGLAAGLTEDGCLLMVLPGGERLAVASGEVLTMEGGGYHVTGG